MIVTIDFDNIELGSKTAEVLQEWLIEKIKDKSTDNISPLRYADRIIFEK